MLSKKELKEELTHILYDQTRRTPIVIPVINEIGVGMGGNMQNQGRINNQNKVPVAPQNFEKLAPIKFPIPKVPDNEAADPRVRFDNRKLLK